MLSFRRTNVPPSLPSHRLCLVILHGQLFNLPKVFSVLLFYISVLKMEAVLQDVLAARHKKDPFKYTTFTSTALPCPSNVSLPFFALMFIPYRAFDTILYYR